MVEQMTGAPDREQISDQVLMYASIFTYESAKSKTRAQIMRYTVNYGSIENLEKQGHIPNGATRLLTEFLGMNPEQQRTWLDSEANLDNCKQLMRNLLQIVSMVSSEPELVRWALALVNGIIEDNRNRIRFLSLLQKSKSGQAEKKLDCIRILHSYLIQNTDVKTRPERDLASHILAQLIAHAGIQKNSEEALNYMHYLLQNKDQAEQLTRHAYTHSLMYLLKINELAKDFVQKRGFNILVKLLVNDCQQDAQIAYNVCSCLWILSYHSFAIQFFQDFNLNVVEHIAKILDFSNKEKIVRMIALIFNNLKNDEICLEHLSMINALNLVIKLRNRPWVDEKITELLKNLFEFFDEHYQEFSSFDKWKKQVQRRGLTWSPVHTEKFWQTSFIMFNDPDNLECINILIDILKEQPDRNMDQQIMDQRKAVACFDLGEFARFFPSGKDFLDQRDTKTYLADLMSNASSSAELKKEAITAYQKMLMHSWGSSGI